jgi:hypothetical protein
MNWMTAGRGITHSERTPPALRNSGSRLFGIQSWVALSRNDEEMSPDFLHYDAKDLPPFYFCDLARSHLRRLLAQGGFATHRNCPFKKRRERRHEQTSTSFQTTRQSDGPTRSQGSEAAFDRGLDRTWT